MNTVVACPTCHEPVVQPAVGRRRIYCSPACRREMYALIGELTDLERQLAETVVLARGAHSDVWRQRHERSLPWLRLAIAERRERIPEALR